LETCFLSDFIIFSRRLLEGPDSTKRFTKKIILVLLVLGGFLLTGKKTGPYLFSNALLPIRRSGRHDTASSSSVLHTIVGRDRERENDGMVLTIIPVSTLIICGVQQVLVGEGKVIICRRNGLSHHCPVK
jgi:hypothetical protein